MEFVVYHRIRFHAVIMVVACILAIGCTEVGPPGIGKDSSTRSALQTQSANRSNKIEANSQPVRCPPAGLLETRVQPGNHRVILSWKAGASRPEAKIIGYCLYRSRKEKFAKQKAACRECEQINVIPFRGTACIDDRVEDGAVYYYAVTAMTAEGIVSSASNETRAAIPRSKKRGNFTGPSYPLCREFSSAK